MLPTGYIPEYYRDARDIVWKADTRPVTTHRSTRLRAALRWMFSKLSAYRDVEEPSGFESQPAA